MRLGPKNLGVGSVKPAKNSEPVCTREFNDAANLGSGELAEQDPMTKTPSQKSKLEAKAEKAVKAWHRQMRHEAASVAVQKKVKAQLEKLRESHRALVAQRMAAQDVAKNLITYWGRA